MHNEHSRLVLAGLKRPGRIAGALTAVLFLASLCAASQAGAADPRLEKAYRFQRGGWTYVHLEGAPAEIGFQHGYLLASEIADALESVKLLDAHQTHRDWEFFRKTAREMLWPHIDAEYQRELQGIADGVKAHGVDLDVWDIVALNAFEEVPDYYVPWLNKREKAGQGAQASGSGELQRVHRDRRVHQRSPDRHRSQQLDQLSYRRALGDRLRHCAAARPAHCDGRLSRSDHER